MRFGIDFTQPSTWRGMIMAGFGLMALIRFALGDMEGGAAITASAATISGLIGVGVKDNPQA